MKMTFRSIRKTAEVSKYHSGDNTILPNTENNFFNPPQDCGSVKIIFLILHKIAEV
jgi:hypothetical protein